jgi:hypothetical protein
MQYVKEVKIKNRNGLFEDLVNKQETNKKAREKIRPH